ncbi:hypothetical protein B0T10DRAFT_463349 [Thelonectria olida]|uniref:Uncharacterized protein n=1 Tax=Thelonectria olida TaxID=1576542 RepID=A0A9P8VXC0_9HYPO|nr:hypothetical protein B0T10DRAFT_463349 [Thelonectria olida]
MSIVKLKRKGKAAGAWGEVPFESGKHAVVCLDGYLSMDFAKDDDGPYYQRAAVQHLAIFVPWESFLTESSGDINSIWKKYKLALPWRVSFLAENVQLLRRSAEDAKLDARQWAALSGEADPTAETAESGTVEDHYGPTGSYRSDSIGDATRLIDVVRSTIGATQITTGSKELTAMVQQLCRF